MQLQGAIWWGPNPGFNRHDMASSESFSRSTWPPDSSKPLETSRHGRRRETGTLKYILRSCGSRSSRCQSSKPPSGAAAGAVILTSVKDSIRDPSGQSSPSSSTNVSWLHIRCTARHRLCVRKQNHGKTRASAASPKAEAAMSASHCSSVASRSKNVL
jgi:hypothetical protein